MVSHCPSNKKSKSLNKPAMYCMICPSLLANLHQLLRFCSCFFSYFWPLVLPFPMPFPIYIVYQVLCLECLAFSAFLFTITTFISIVPKKISWPSPLGFPGASVIKNPPANSGDTDSIPGSGSSPGGGKGNSLPWSFLENHMNREAWQTTVHKLAKIWAQLSNSACIQARTTITCLSIISVQARVPPSMFCSYSPRKQHILTHRGCLIFVE